MGIWDSVFLGEWGTWDYGLFRIGEFGTTSAPDGRSASRRRCAVLSEPDSTEGDPPGERGDKFGVPQYSLILDDPRSRKIKYANRKLGINYKYEIKFLSKMGSMWLPNRLFRAAGLMRQFVRRYYPPSLSNFKSMFRKLVKIRKNPDKRVSLD